MSRAYALLFFTTVAVVLTACGDESITSTSGRVMVSKVLSGDGQTATVNSPVAVPPSVRVAGENGDPIAGAAVVFQVSTGGGSVTGERAVSDPFGIATVGAWVLGQHPGANTLSAAVAGATPVFFSATSLVGPPAILSKTAGDNQEGDVSNFAADAPTVVVTDAYENPLEGVTVTFSVTSGGGQIWGAVQGIQITDGTGTARVWGWKLGPAPGPNTLEAAIAGLPAATFTVNGVDHCTAPDPYAFGSTVDGTLAVGDCRLSGEFTHRYAATATNAQSLRFDMASSAFFSHVSLFDASGALVASGQGTPVRVLVAPGDYVVGAGGFDYGYDDEPVGGVVGPYSLGSTVVPEDITGCNGGPPVFIVRGVTTAQRIETTDCVESIVTHGSTYTFYHDWLYIYMTAGQTYTISMSSSDFDTYLELFEGGRVEFNDDFGGTSDSRITFTPTWSGQYAIRATTHGSDATGSYSLTVE